MLELDPEFARTRFFLGMAYEANGQPDEAVEEYRKGLTLSGGSSVVHCMLARGLAAAGDVEGTFEYLNRAFDERSSWLVSLNIEPLLDPIRNDPRFAALVRRVGLP